MSEPIVDIKDLRLSFFTPAGGVKALNGVSLRIMEGEVLGIVGESGSGKSVSGYTLMGLVQSPGRIIGGEVLFNGRRIDRMTEKEMRRIRGNEISIIFQDPLTSLNPVYTIGNQIAKGQLEKTFVRTIPFMVIELIVLAVVTYWAPLTLFFPSL